MKLTKAEIKNIIKEEIQKLFTEMFEQTPLPEEGDIYAHTYDPESQNTSVEVQASTNPELIRLRALGDGFSPKVRRGQIFQMPTEIFFQTFVEKSDEIDPDTGKRVNVLNLGNRGEEQNGY